MRKLFRKKGIALLLATVLIMTSLAGCSKKADEDTKNPAVDKPKTDISKTDEKVEEPVELNVFFSVAYTPDLDKVSEAVSAITKEKINVTVKFNAFGANEYKDKIALLIASNEKMDIGFDAGWLAYVDRARNGAYYDISDILETEAPELLNTINPLLWEGAYIDGGLYGVPTYKELAEQWALTVETSFVEENNIDISKIKTLKDAEVILEALMLDTNRAGFMALYDAKHENLVRQAYYDSIGNTQGGLAQVSKTEGKTIVNFFETEEYKEFIALMRDWYNKGYIAQDAAIREGYSEYALDAVGRFGLSYTSYSPQSEINLGNAYGAPLSVIPLTPVTTTNSSVTGSINCIYAKSEHPVEALKFLELWNTDPDIKNLITYGIQDVHYNLVDGKVVKTPEQGMLYSNANWRTGNMFISHPQDGETDDKFEQYDLFNDQATASRALGFQPTTTSIDDKIAACSSVIAEFSSILSIGAVDPDAEYPRFIKALKSAGSDDIIEELQKQYDEWLNTK